MESIKATVLEAADRIRELGQRSDQIGRIVAVISDIARQTDLLALNAAIEAARAGEHGSGFAVVADEVRKLAERSAAATKDIAGLIAGIRETSEVTVKAMDAGVTEVEKGVEFTAEVTRAFQAIAEMVAGTNNAVSQVVAQTQDIATSAENLVNHVNSAAQVTTQNGAATREMASDSDHVDQAIGNISSVSEETAASAEEVSAATAEMHSTIGDIADRARQLSERAAELKGLVDRFKVK
jgi:methyl-accepting chemotaxis protein